MCSVDVRFIAIANGHSLELRGATVYVHPLKDPRDHGLHVEAGSLIAGQIQRFPVRKAEVMELISEAARGAIVTPSGRATLPADARLGYYSEEQKRDRWICNLHLRVTGGVGRQVDASELAAIDDALRCSTTPFDGTTDLASWLGLAQPESSDRMPSVDISVAAPVDLLDVPVLENGRLDLRLVAHPQLETSLVSLALRIVPGGGLSSRRQIGAHVSWDASATDRRLGRVQVDTPEAHNALAMLMVGGRTVRRQWFADRARGENIRLLAMQHFDPDLRKLRNGIFLEQKQFERAVSALFFLQGFEGAIPLETDAPDILLVTPLNRLVIVECTTRVADVAAKLGKLVDRRGALSKSLVASRQTSHVVALLVCRLPREQIAATSQQLIDYNVLLLTEESLSDALDGLRFSQRPDETLDRLLATQGLQKES